MFAFTIIVIDRAATIVSISLLLLTIYRCSSLLLWVFRVRWLRRPRRERENAFDLLCSLFWCVILAFHYFVTETRALTHTRNVLIDIFVGLKCVMGQKSYRNRNYLVSNWFLVYIIIQWKYMEGLWQRPTTRMRAHTHTHQAWRLPAKPVRPNECATFSLAILITIIFN